MHAALNDDWVQWLLKSDQEIFSQSRYRHHAALIKHGMQHINDQAQAVRIFLHDAREDIPHFHEVDTELALQECQRTLQGLLPKATLQIEWQTELTLQLSLVNTAMKIDTQQPLNGNYRLQTIKLTFLLTCHDIRTFHVVTGMSWSTFFKHYFSQLYVTVHGTLAEPSPQLDNSTYLFFLFG